MINRNPKEPVKLRRKPLAGGNISLYLDIYINGRRDYKFLQLYLVPETDAAARRQNKETLDLANSIKAKYIVDIQRGIHDFAPKTKSKASFVDFVNSVIEEKKAAGEHGAANWECALIHIKAYARNKDILFSDLTPEWCQGFIDYLRDACKYNRGGELTEERLSPGAANSYFTKFRTALNFAVKRGIIATNPATHVRNIPKPKESPREYLTIEELRRISAAECDDPELKRAFLFACLTGLRRSDIEKLTWGEIHAEEGRTRIIFRQKKTGGLEYLDITQQAAGLLGEPAKPDDLVFHLSPPTYANINLRLWATRANINKHLTFHSGRHTFAVMMLTLGVDLYTVSKLLGHRDIKTTQIYARIVDSKKQEAVDIIPKIL